MLFALQVCVLLLFCNFHLVILFVSFQGRKKDLESNQQLIEVSREIDRQKVKVDELVREVGDADYLGTRNKCNELEEQYTKIFQEAS